MIRAEATASAAPEWPAEAEGAVRDLAGIVFVEVSLAEVLLAEVLATVLPEALVGVLVPVLDPERRTDVGEGLALAGDRDAARLATTAAEGLPAMADLRATEALPAMEALPAFATDLVIAFLAVDRAGAGGDRLATFLAALTGDPASTFVLDFVPDFLGIRLPFVAFPGSIDDTTATGDR